MSLLIKVISYQGQPPLNPMSAIFDQQGGKIGRSTNCHLVLQDPHNYISRDHAIIAYKDGSYYLEDDSLEGTFLTRGSQHLHHEKIQLRDGDRLIIGDYELEVSIRGNQDAEISPRPPKEPKDEKFDPGPDSPNNPADESGFCGRGGNDPSQIPNDIDDFFPEDSEIKKPPEQHNRHKKQSESDNSAERYARPPDADELETIKMEPLEAYSELWRFFLKGAALESLSNIDSEEIPEFMHMVGGVFRELLEGLVTILRGRTKLKSRIRVPVTTLAKTENNPLKFTADIDEAVELMFNKNRSGYIGPVDAVREGFDDIMNHQVALTAGVEASLMQVIDRFAPQNVTKQYEEGLVFQKKAKCWDAYAEAYRGIAQEALNDFFGNVFARAYEEKMSKLSEARQRRNQT